MLDECREHAGVYEIECKRKTVSMCKRKVVKVQACMTQIVREIPYAYMCLWIQV